MAVWQMKKMAK